MTLHWKRVYSRCEKSNGGQGGTVAVSQQKSGIAILAWVWPLVSWYSCGDYGV